MGEAMMELFSSVNLVNKAIDTALVRKELISQNISNVDTPGYKRKDIDFESLLAKEVELRGISNIDVNNLNAKVYIDHQTSTYRLDGNNVDIQVEKSEEAKVEMRYNALISRMTSQLNRFKTTLQNLK